MARDWTQLPPEVQRSILEWVSDETDEAVADRWWAAWERLMRKEAANPPERRP